jgi:hypothetical protein
MDWCVSSGFLSELAQAALLVLELGPDPAAAGRPPSIASTLETLESNKILKVLLMARELHLMLFAW